MCLTPVMPVPQLSLAGLFMDAHDWLLVRDIGRDIHNFQQGSFVCGSAISAPTDVS